MHYENFRVGKILKLNCLYRSINSILYGVTGDETVIVLKVIDHTIFRDYLVYTLGSQRFLEVADFELSEVVA